MAKQKSEEIQNTSELSKNTLNSLLKGYEDTHYNFIERKDYKVTSGSLVLDSYIKVRSGMTIRLGGPAEVGKAQPLWAKVLTPYGWKEIGSLKQGNLIIGSDGLPHQVLGVFPQGKKQINKIIFSDKTETHCCDEHLWFTKDINDRNNNKKGSVKTTNQIKNTLKVKNRNNHSISYIKPVTFSENKEELQLNGYILGLLLGDGCFRQGSHKNQIGFSTSDKDIINSIEKLLPDNINIRQVSKYDFQIFGDGLGKIIDSLNLRDKFSYEKHIPKEYLFSSIENRKLLLQGLMDTDGTTSFKSSTNCSTTEYCTTSKQLANDVLFLVRSLGGRATISDRYTLYTYKGIKKKGKKSYRIIISFTDFCPFSLQRKRILYKNRTTELEKYIEEIKPCKIEECVCIKIDSEDSLYVTDDFILTHNTSQSLLFAQNYMNVVPKSKTIYINAEAKFGQEIKDRLGMKFTESSDEWEYGTVFVLQTNVFDTICNMLESLLKQMFSTGEHLCIIIDSVDMLTLKSNMEKNMSDGKKPAGVNYLTKEMFRRLGHFIHSYDALLLMITQYASTFKLDTYAKDEPKTMDGNNTHALNHQMSYGLYYRPRFQGDYILEDPNNKKPDPEKNKILGINVKIDLRKTATDETGITVEIPIKRNVVGSAIWVEKEVCDSIFFWQFAVKAGAWIKFKDEIIEMAKSDSIELKQDHNGINKLYTYLEENKAITDWFVKKFRCLLDN